MATKRPEQAPREEHLGDARAQVRFMLWILGPPFLLGLAGVLFGGPTLALLGGIFVVASFAGLAVYAVVLLTRVTMVDSAAGLAGKLLMPSGASTPPQKALSHIESMVARGDYARAADAYKHEIETDPTDLGSCERLGQLALRELKDPQLAVWAYREGEKRAETPARRFGLGLLVAGIYRDQLRDRGKTVVELRRLVERYPDAPQLERLRAEIEELKAGMFDAPPS
jgi:hypothetical protein